METWITNRKGAPHMLKLADDTIRVELGPEIVELVADSKTLSNKVTHPKYYEGAIDALGRKIVKGEKMHVVDWRGKITPKVWKVYAWNPERMVANVFQVPEPVPGFEQVKTFAKQEDAEAFARNLAGSK